MKAGLAAILAIMSGLSALPASAREAAARPVALSTDDLPLTPRFASLLTSYRNCVLEQVDASPLGLQQDMAKGAMDACAISRGELRAQLIADIQAKQPTLSRAVTLRSADGGLAQVDPMIADAAVERAHKRYASTMY